MYFVRQGDFIGVVRISGVENNLLLRLGEASGAEPIVVRLPAVESGKSSGLEEDRLVAAVLRGVATANSSLHKALVVTHIRYVAADTPSVATYESLAEAIVRQVCDGGKVAGS
jgi:hypothetical protein